MITLTLIDGTVLSFDMKSFEAEKEFVEKFHTMPLNRIMDLKRLGKYTVAQIDTIKHQPIKEVILPGPEEKSKQKLQETVERMTHGVEDRRQKMMETFVAAVTERLGYFPEDDPSIIDIMEIVGDCEDWKLPMLVNMACHNKENVK